MKNDHSITVGSYDARKKSTHTGCMTNAKIILRLIFISKSSSSLEISVVPPRSPRSFISFNLFTETHANLPIHNLKRNIINENIIHHKET